MAGQILQRGRIAFLAEATTSRRALLLGEGPGRFLVELLRANPHVHVTCVERSPRMIQAARAEMKRQGADAARATFLQQDALTWQPPHSAFDLVVTSFFLDCFRREELERLVSKVSVGATDQAGWLLTDFRQPDRGWRKWRAKLVLALMYAFFRFTTGLSASKLTPPDEFLEAARFRLVEQRLANFGLVHSDLWRRSQR